MPGIRVDLTALKLAYLNREGSTTSLAKRFNLPIATVRRRAHQEGWVSLRNVNADSAIQSSAQTEQIMARLGSVHALRFIERVISQTNTLLGMVEDQINLAKNHKDPATLKTMVETWRLVVSTGRTAWGLDAQDHGQRGGPVGMHSLRSDPGTARILDAQEVPTPPAPLTLPNVSGHGEAVTPEPTVTPALE